MWSLWNCGYPIFSVEPIIKLKLTLILWFFTPGFIFFLFCFIAIGVVQIRVLPILYHFLPVFGVMLVSLLFGVVGVVVVSGFVCGGCMPAGYWGTGVAVAHQLSVNIWIIISEWWIAVIINQLEASRLNQQHNPLSNNFLLYIEKKPSYCQIFPWKNKRPPLLNQSE